MLASRQRSRQPGPVHGPGAERGAASAAAPAVPGGTTLARAERLGHRIDRLPVPVAAVSRERIQRVLSEEEAATLVAANTPAIESDGDWPRDEPRNPWTWFRSQRGAQRGALRAVEDHPGWRDDVGGRRVSQERITAAVRARYAQVQAERRRLAEAAALAAAQEKADAVPQALQNHVFLGDFSGATPTGFHSKAGASATHEAYGATTVVPAGLGIYQQSVRGRANADARWARKPIQSTFFPDLVGARAATTNDVNLALGTGRASAHKRVSHPVEWNAMTLKKVGETWFPAGGTDRLAAPLP